MEATSGLEPLVEILQTSALPLGYVATSEKLCFIPFPACGTAENSIAAKFFFLSPKSKNRFLGTPELCGAGNEARTRYLHLGKVALYQMSYARISTLCFPVVRALARIIGCADINSR